MIPKFRSNGYLPPGEHPASWAEVVERFGWSGHRRDLLGGLLAACRDLKKGGIKRIWLDGGFTTKKRAEPKDYDGCWSASEMKDDSKVDPVWFQLTAPRDAMKAKFKGELVPAEYFADLLGTPYSEYFKKDRDGKAKGIVVIDLETLP
jgi:hypothetical protein